jgi:hypothetical protein
LQVVEDTEEALCDGNFLVSHLDLTHLHSMHNPHMKAGNATRARHAALTFGDGNALA